MGIETELALIAKGDRAAFSRAYRELQPVMLCYATGLLAGDRAAAEDAVDEAFIAIWQQAGRFDARGNAMGWVRRIVRNKAVDWLRKQREVPLHEEYPECETPDDDSPFDLADQAFTATRLRAALSTLSVEQREAVWLCYYEGKSLSEIADIAQCPENTVKTRLFHARKLLRQSKLLEESTASLQR